MYQRDRMIPGCLAAAILVVTLGGCSSGDPEPRVEDDVVEETVFDPMTGTMDRAREVEELSNSRMDRLNEELEESGESRP